MVEPDVNRGNGWGKLLIWALVCLLVPAALLRTRYPQLPKAAATTKITEDVAPDQMASLVKDLNAERINVPLAISRLQAERPDYVGIGNSMILCRLGVDGEDMRKLTGRKFHYLLHGASASAVWYMTLKNIVAASGVKPRMVFFFFRDNELTAPLFHTAGTYSVYLNSMRGKQEPVLDAILHGPEQQQDMVSLLSRHLTGEHGLYDFPEWSETTNRSLVNRAMGLGAPWVDKGALHRSLALRFSLDHLRPDVPVDLPPPSTGVHDKGSAAGLNDPTAALGGANRSFLPAMMQVAREQGIKLLFFRVKKRPEADNITHQTPEMRADMQRLQRWIEQQGGLFYDETDDADLPLSVYNDGDHLGPEQLGWYEKYFWKRAGPLFP